MIYADILRNLLFITACALGWVIISPFAVLFLVIILCLLLIRKCADLIVLKSHPDWKPISGPDAFYSSLLDTYKNHALYNPTTMFTLQNQLNETETQLFIQNLREKFQERVLESKVANDPFWKFKCVPVTKMGFYYWAPLQMDDFSEYIHVHVQDGSRKMSEDELNTFVANSWSISSYQGRSPWEIMLVDTEDVGQVLCCRIGHVIGGGCSFRYILEALNGEMNESGIPLLVKPRPYTYKSMAYTFFIFPWNILHTLNQIYSSDNTLQLKGLTKVQVLGTGLLQLPLAKKISKSYNCPLRNVLLVAFGGALRKYQLERWGKIDELKSYVLCMVVPWFYSEPSSITQLHNEIATVAVTYPHNSSNPVKRLVQTNEDIERSLACGYDFYMYNATCLTGIIPAFLLRLTNSTQYTIPNTSSDIFFGSRTQLYILGQPVKNPHLFASVNRMPIGCMVAFMTNGNEVGISLLADERIIPTNKDAHRVCQYFQEELEDIEKYGSQLEVENSKLKQN